MEKCSNSVTKVVIVRISAALVSPEQKDYLLAGEVGIVLEGYRDSFGCGEVSDYGNIYLCDEHALKHVW